MFLKKLKLAGFKSFVDPVTLTFPGKLSPVGSDGGGQSNIISSVVGPNGSGKSNIIDAVSWVLGEKSMKYLRGDVLTDVIFNGSMARKPVGQASVELVFDNQNGTIGGEYSQYAEISIKRLITRDSDSVYYLNNSPCRRRDILDILRGTGLGPRSYSIIGQNMVSRIVESKPADMRAYLEEAAGISKYKERRHETELRIKHTHDNLSRVNDLRSELDRQLSQLKRQASDAERYKTLKQQERVFKSQWHAVQWRQLDTELSQYTLNIQRDETALEAQQSELIKIETALEQGRQEQRVASDAFQEVQRRYYAVGNEIARIEQDLKHQQERQQQWETDLRQMDAEWQEANHQMEELHDEQQDLSQEISQLTPEWEKAVVTAKQALSTLTETEGASQAWQTRWDDFHQKTMQVSQKVEIEGARIQHLEQKLQTIKHQQSKIQHEQGEINFSELEKEVEILSQQLQELETEGQGYEQEFETVKGDISRRQVERQHLNQELDQLRSELQILRGKEASIDALQQAALGQHDQLVLKWLAQHALDKKPRLAQGIDVEKGWELAVEKVLGPYLQAVCVDEIAAVTPNMANLSEGHLLMFSQQLTHGEPKDAVSSSVAPKLLDKVSSTLPIHALLAGIYIADTLDAALALLPNMAVNESVITRDGLWLSPAWLRVSREKDPKMGVFQREQELKQLGNAIAELKSKQINIESSQEEQHEMLSQLEQRRDELQQMINQQHTRFAEVAAQTKAKQQRLIELKQKAQLLEKEEEEYRAQEKQAVQELQTARENWQGAQSGKEKMASERDSLIAERDKVRSLLQQAREAANVANEEAHQLEIRLQSSKSQQGSLKQTLERMQVQLTVLAEKKQATEKELNEAQPLENLKTTLASTLEKHVAIEKELNAARELVETREQELAALGKQRHTVEENTGKVRDSLEKSRLESQSLKLKGEALQEQIKELNFSLTEVLKDLPENALAEELQNEYERTVQKIHRLGSINLIAVEEYATCQERKQYLDKQYEDLQSSLTTLENAIAKIDRETRARFKEVYDQINQRFQELFPLVFGGGHASLELTDDNLLESGVTVMACPPGKRNSSINLLSGGEKTMTAIALIFSIFHLNPSPLCLLDEVDAALDDVNVSRFCELVKKMSGNTQFIFISHNKLAIEMAEHLIGITMHEPGVSRVVSVDVQEALKLASA